MKWYNKYLAVQGKTLSEVNPQIIEQVKTNLVRIQSSQPIATVSVIGYNEERNLLACLWSLSDAQCKYPIEIIGVNNNSKDRTEDVYKSVNLPYCNELIPGCGHARLCGLNKAKGKYHLNIDADTMYPPHYIETMINELEKPGVVGVSSLWSYIPDENHSSISLKFYEFSRDFYLYLQSFKRPELSVRGLVFGYRTKEAQEVGIRTDIIRGEDGSLALSLKPYGKIKFIRKRKARAVTGYGTVGIDGSLFQSFKNRVIKAIKNLSSLFTSKKQYKDNQDNLL